jgi:hypothetical protein
MLLRRAFRHGTAALHDPLRCDYIHCDDVQTARRDELLSDCADMLHHGCTSIDCKGEFYQTIDTSSFKRPWSARVLSDLENDRGHVQHLLDKTGLIYQKGDQLRTLQRLQ